MEIVSGGPKPAGCSGRPVKQAPMPHWLQGPRFPSQGSRTPGVEVELMQTPSGAEVLV